MILAELEIEDYKQFAGVHRFTPPLQGIVGIIGPNGAGKTTLFEAIEWCLYNPREIVAEEIPPRGQVAKPRVRVILQDTDEGIRYVIERTLRRGVSNAEIYREDQPESRIVSGPRQVTDYVARNLIGLDHRAFISTFFTRQKELTFFGTLKETERRRAVGRLLGLETIRAAQMLITEDRGKARNEATVLQNQYNEQRADRDFAAETTAAEETIAVRAVALADAEQSVTSAHAAHATARNRLAALQALERRDGDLRQDLARVAGDERTAASQRDAATATLARLDEAATSRARYDAIAAEEPLHAETIARHEADRERQVQLDRLRADADRATRSVTASTGTLQKIVREANATEIPGWAWLSSDAADPVAAADRLIAVAEGQDFAQATEHATRLSTCHDLAVARDEAGKQFERYERNFRKLEDQRDDLLRSGNPRSDVAEAQLARDAALAAVQKAGVAADQARQTAAQLMPIVASLKSQKFEDRCPTCARPFSPDELDITLAALEDRIDAANERLTQLERQRKQAQQQAAAIEKTQQAAAARLEALTNLEGRLSQGRPMVEEQRALWAKATDTCAAALARHGFATEPSKQEVDAARTRADLLHRIAASIAPLVQMRASADQALRDRRSAEGAIAALGQVSYDAKAHAAAQKALTTAREAAATVRQIDRDLARRPDAEAQRTEAVSRLKLLGEERAQIETARADLGFDPQSLKQADLDECAALAAERRALETRSSATEAHRMAIAARDRLLEDFARIARLAERADARNREADQLDLMYREFTLFEQYVARRMTPHLAEHTSELLAAVTDNKYDRVEFNENYGIEVYDGADERFPMEEFSGGERDVIALCARLALSRLIGSQAKNPPGFLVLDEVFGALDRDRRAQVLETLAALSGTADAFHQLFIISHVDDVRTAPIFSEVWRVAETSDGVSTLENLSESHGMEDF